jgi:hypothetical protein
MASFVGGKTKRVDVGQQGRSKKHKISVYEHPPMGEVSMEEFEQYALDRMRVCKCAINSLSKERERTGLPEKRARITPDLTSSAC